MEIWIALIAVELTLLASTVTVAFWLGTLNEKVKTLELRPMVNYDARLVGIELAIVHFKERMDTFGDELKALHDER